MMRQAKLGDFLAKRSRGIVPASTPDETYELYSVPAFEGKRPEVVAGGQIGSNKQIVDPGTVLLCKINPRINRAWAVGSFTKHQKIASTEWITFPPHPEVEPRYLAHYLCRKEIRDYLAANASGVGGSLMRVKASTVEDLPLPLPSVDEQHRIVAEIEEQFSRLDEAVANLKRARANLLRYHVRVLGDAADGWPTTPLGSLLREPLRNGHSAKATDDPNGLRAFTLTAVTVGDFTARNTKRTVAEPRKVADLWAYPGDIYIERSNTPELVGTARLYSGPPAFAFIPDLLIRVRVDESALSPEFAEVALRSEAARRYFRSKAQGIAGSMPKIDQGVVEAFAMPLPPLAEQRRIVAEVDRRLSIVREVEAEVDSNLQRAQSLRQAMLHAAFGDAVGAESFKRASLATLLRRTE